MLTFNDLSKAGEILKVLLQDTVVNASFHLYMAREDFEELKANSIKFWESLEEGRDESDRFEFKEEMDRFGKLEKLEITCKKGSMILTVEPMDPPEVKT